MSTKASIKALTDPNNAKTRWTHRKIAYNALKDCELTIREIATKTRLTYNQVQKRISELLEDGMITEYSGKQENGQPNTIFRINPNPPKPSPKKPTLSQFVKEHYPHILVEYNGRNNHKIN